VESRTTSSVSQLDVQCVAPLAIHERRAWAPVIVAARSSGGRNNGGGGGPQAKRRTSARACPFRPDCPAGTSARLTYAEF
jgi:hypothetical protein